MQAPKLQTDGTVTATGAHTTNAADAATGPAKARGQSAPVPVACAACSSLPTAPEAPDAAAAAALAPIGSADVAADGSPSPAAGTTACCTAASPDRSPDPHSAALEADVRAIPQDSPQGRAFSESLQCPHTRALLCEWQDYIPRSKSDRLRAPSSLQKLRTEAGRLQDEGRYHAAYAVLCQLAYWTFSYAGETDERTLRAVEFVILNASVRGEEGLTAYMWFLSRVGQQCGISEVAVQHYIQDAAHMLYAIRDPRVYVELTHIVTELSAQLPGGLGWGSTVVAPVPDEETFYKHCVLESRAIDMYNTRTALPLARQMFERCVTYFTSLGPHWQGVCRKVRCMMRAASCMLAMSKDKFGDEAKEMVQRGESELLQAKRLSQHELGATHPVTLDIMMIYGEHLVCHGRYQQGLSYYQKALRLRHETCGPYHHMVMAAQDAVARILGKLGRVSEAEAMLVSTFDLAIKAHGPNHMITDRLLSSHWGLLLQQGKLREAKALRTRAAKLGCDVSRLM